ncbi:MAG: tetratricopeptide repeat protein [Candidatus Omnitrophica bacterium]|nr:tetratricopeptide repeat protein [Candidatus Omnitrophota bacterium]
MRRIFNFVIILLLLGILVYVGRPKLAVFLSNQGCDYYDSNLYDEAIASFQRSLQVNPDVAATHCYLADAYMQNKIEARAIEEYKEAIRIDPSYIQAYCALSQIYSDHQMYEEALNQLKDAESILPSNQEIKQLQEAVSFEYAADCLDKGTSLFLSADKPKAYILLNKALEVKPELVFAHYTLAYFYFTEQKYDKAERSLNRLLDIDSQFMSAYKLLGDIYFYRANYEKAVTNYKTALNLNCNDPVVYNDLGLSLMQMERYDEALVYLKKAARLNPNNSDLRYSLASVYRDKGMFDDAIREYKKVIRYQADYPNIHNDLGDIYLQQGKSKEALKEYGKEIEYCRARLLNNPDNPIILNNLAYALNEVGEYNKAEEIIGRVINSRPNYRGAYLTLAKIYKNLGNFEQEIIALNKAKALSVSRDFIDRDIAWARSDLASSLENKSNISGNTSFFATDTIYLKNGRQIKGRIKEETKEKIVLEVKLGDVIGSVTFYRDTIERLVRSDDKK